MNSTKLYRAIYIYFEMFLFKLLFFINVMYAEDFAYPWQNIFEHPVSEILKRARFLMKIFDIFCKSSYLYESVDDHHERSIHETDGFKNALQNMIHTGKMAYVQKCL